MTTQTITLPCKITFEWFPEEAETKWEPKIEEEFYITEAKLLGLDLTMMLSDWGDSLEDSLYKYLKENKDES